MPVAPAIFIFVKGPRICLRQGERIILSPSAGSVALQQNPIRPLSGTLKAKPTRTIPARSTGQVTSRRATDADETLRTLFIKNHTY